MESGLISGQRSWNVPNKAMSARAGSFMWRMRADEENTIMPESGDERKDCGIVTVPQGGVASVPETVC
jgi:hypothetical protein